MVGDEHDRAVVSQIPLTDYFEAHIAAQRRANDERDEQTQRVQRHCGPAVAPSFHRT